MSMPRNEGPLALWLGAFRDRLLQERSRYFVSDADVQTVKRVVDEFIEARRVANNPATRTVQTVGTKEACRISAVELCRVYYALVQRNQGISNDDKMALGVTPLGSSRSRRPCPQSSPAVAVVACTPGAMTLTYCDSVNPTSRKKPFGATMCQLFVVVADRNASTMDGARFAGNFTTNPMAVVFDPSQRGKQATFFARWGGKRNEFGQWSLPVSMTIAA